MDLAAVTAHLAAATAGTAADVPPLTPDGDEARRWAENELADPAYAAAQPNAIDRISQAVGRFFASLFSTPVDGGVGPWIAVVVAVVVVLLIVAAFLIWGRPRALRRGAPPVAELFGETETRRAAELRAAADAHAARGEWDAAIVVRFRALARGAAERELVQTPPGATVHGFARTAARVIPAEGAALESAAAAFDDVRYLRRPGTADLYARVVATDEALQHTTVSLAERTPEPIA